MQGKDFSGKGERHEKSLKHGGVYLGNIKQLSMVFCRLGMEIEEQEVNCERT